MRSDDGAWNRGQPPVRLQIASERDGQSLNTDYLIEFLAFSKSLNYAKVSKELFISQPALIQHIERLEEEIGVPLVVHHGKSKRPSLTLAGTVLSYSAKEMLDVCSKVTDECREASFRESSTLHIQDIRSHVGIHPVFFESLKSFRTTAPSICFEDSLDHADLSSHELLAADRSIDIAFSLFFRNRGMANFMEREAGSHTFAVLPSEECYVLVASDHPLASCDAVSLDDLAKYRLMVCEHQSWKSFFDELIEDLRERVPNLAVGYFAPESKQDPLLLSQNNIRIYPATHARTAVSYWEGSIATVRIADYDAYVTPVALCRKDNPKKCVHDFFNRLNDELSPSD